MKILDATNYEESIKEGVVLVDFYADWCGPCKMIAPFLEQLAEEYADKASIYKVNVDNSSDIAAKYGIRSIPTMILFKDGEILKTSVGFAPKSQIAELLNSALED